MTDAQPLAGTRVLDFTSALSGPFCTLLLADLGADVVKIEGPEGDQSRGWGPPFIEGESTYFLSENRNKRSIGLDLKSPSGYEAARKIAAHADVLVENMRPGVLDRLQLGSDLLRRANPRLIYCSISGFGAGDTRAGYDQIVQGSGGLMSLTGEPGGPPTKLGVPIGDLSSGMFAAHAIMASLLERERTGLGRFIDISMQDSIMSLLTYQAGRFFATGTPPLREGNFHPTIVPYGTFATADGYINIGVGTETQYRAFCPAIGMPELLSDPRFATNRDRQQHRREIYELVEPRLRERPTAEWVTLLEKAGVPTGPILDLGEAFDLPEVAARELVVTAEHPVAGRIRSVGSPWRIDGERSAVRRPPPRLGEHTEEVLAEL